MLKGAEKLIRLSLMTLRDIREVVIPTKIYETDYITGCIFRNDWDSGPNSCVARVCSIEEGIIGDTQTVAKMMTKLERMLTENLMTDAIFRDGETEFRLHTFVLKLWSAKFQDIEHGRQVHFNDPGALNTHLLLVKVRLSTVYLAIFLFSDIFCLSMLYLHFCIYGNGRICTNWKLPGIWTHGSVALLWHFVMKYHF